MQAQVRGEPTAAVTQLDLALVVLGVDNPDAGRRDDEVVDVAAGAWDPAIVEDNSGVAQIVGQTARQSAAPPIDRAAPSG